MRSPKRVEKTAVGVTKVEWSGLGRTIGSKISKIFERFLNTSGTPDRVDCCGIFKTGMVELL